mmetsp:Transcript_11269/g.27065  ORF Transcript_11269/g.27065 Transcript_11269/m.27065 type:complete len:200 (-) Transcript_11269:289-888(-)
MRRIDPCVRFGVRFVPNTFAGVLRSAVWSLGGRRRWDSTRRHRGRHRREGLVGRSLRGRHGVPDDGQGCEGADEENVGGHESSPAQNAGSAGIAGGIVHPDDHAVGPRSEGLPEHDPPPELVGRPKKREDPGHEDPCVRVRQEASRRRGEGRRRRRGCGGGRSRLPLGSDRDRSSDRNVLSRRRRRHSRRCFEAMARMR